MVTMSIDKAAKFLKIRNINISFLLSILSFLDHRSFAQSGDLR